MGGRFESFNLSILGCRPGGMFRTSLAADEWLRLDASCSLQYNSSLMMQVRDAELGPNTQWICAEMPTASRMYECFVQGEGLLVRIVNLISFLLAVLIRVSPRIMCIAA